MESTPELYDSVMKMGKTPGQELSDLLYGLQMTVKILEGIMMEHEKGEREQTDYESRVHSQSLLLNSNLKSVKPLVERLFVAAYSRFKSNESAVSSVSKEDVLAKEGEAVASEA
jgi:hypothetical protein